MGLDDGLDDGKTEPNPIFATSGSRRGAIVGLEQPLAQVI
jgi:hypothetical protein